MIPNKGAAFYLGALCGYVMALATLSYISTNENRKQINELKALNKRLADVVSGDEHNHTELLKCIFADRHGVKVEDFEKYTDKTKKFS